MFKLLAVFWIYIHTVIFFSNIVQAQQFEHFQGLNNTSYHNVESKALGRNFHIYIRTPANYAGSTKEYPVIYLLDGGHTFPMLASYYNLLTIGEEVPDAILIGISYGTDDYRKGNFRSTDFTAKAISRAHYGGASNFQIFLKKELMPYVESNFRTDTNRRIIFGQSLGGQFVLYTALTDPNLFWGHIASNPALHRNLPFFIKPLEGVETSKSKVYVASGSEDDPRFRQPAKAWIKHWSNIPELPWDLKTVTLEGESHLSATPVAFRKGLRWLFGS